MIAQSEAESASKRDVRAELLNSEPRRSLSDQIAAEHESPLVRRFPSKE
jgi:hypothetical protein